MDLRYAYAFARGSGKTWSALRLYLTILRRARIYIYIGLDCNSKGPFSPFFPFLDLVCFVLFIYLFIHSFSQVLELSHVYGNHVQLDDYGGKRVVALSGRNLEKVLPDSKKMQTPEKRIPNRNRGKLSLPTIVVLFPFFFSFYFMHNGLISTDSIQDLDYLIRIVDRLKYSP